MPLRQANRTNTKRFQDGDDWIELRTELTHGERLDIAQLNQNYRVDAAALAGITGADRHVELEARIAATKRLAFGFLIIDWSLTDEDGNDVPATVDSYDSLDEESGQWVDDRIDEALGEVRKRAEGNGSSKPKRRSSRGSSRSAAPSTPSG